MPATQDKIDLYKLHKAEYAAKVKPAIVRIGPAKYLVSPGEGAPGGESFQRAMGALYGMAYTIKFNSKFAGRDYVVCRLEGLYWTSGSAGGKSAAFDATTRPEDLKWKMLIRVPDFIGEKHMKDARKALVEKDKGEGVDDVALETIREGTCVQILHVGPYDQERETIETMLAFAAEQGYEPNGRHHEIYLNDPRRVEPARLKTIIRQPVRKKK